MNTAAALRLEARFEVRSGAPLISAASDSLTAGGGHYHAVSANVINARPMAASMLVGRRVDEALGLVPVLFSLCGRAQTIAATAACVAAGYRPAAQTTAAEGARLIIIERIQEHLWRLMLDWPTLLGHAPQRQRFAMLHRQLQRLVDEPQRAQHIGDEVVELLDKALFVGFFRAQRDARGLEDVLELAQRGGVLGATLADLILIGEPDRRDAAAPLLAAHAASHWCERLNGMPTQAFCRAPEWNGVAHETGALARHAGSALVAILLAAGYRIAARLLARVVDLAACVEYLRQPSPTNLPQVLDATACAAGTGLATAETARGLLLHAVRIEDQHIVEYAIVAPTEWNFHASGAFVIEGSGWHAPQREPALRRLEALALALDPCVEHQLVPLECDHA